MRRRSRLWQKTAFLLASLLLGCNSPPRPANSFTDVYTTIIGRTCTNDFCHYAAIGLLYGSLDMNSQVTAYWNLVDQPCQSPACAKQGTRVIPGDPGKSVLYQKVSQPLCGAQMPANIDLVRLPTPEYGFSGTALTAEEQKLIHDWIWDGAQNN